MAYSTTPAVAQRVASWLCSFGWLCLNASPAFAAPASSVASVAELRLAVSLGPVSLPIYVAADNNYFAQEGVGVQLRDCVSGRSCFQSMARGESDLATTAELVVAVNSFGGADVAILASMSSTMNSIRLVTRRSSVRSPADLRQKRIGTVAGTSAQFFLDNWLVYQAIDPSDITVVPMAPDRLAAALKAGEVDAIAIWEPIATAAMRALGDDAVALPDPHIYKQHWSLVASRTAVTTQAEPLIKFLRALARAERFIADEPARAAQILSRHLAPATPATDLREFDFKLVLDQSLVSTMEGQARWAVRQGLVSVGQRPPNLLLTIEPSLLRAAVPGSSPLMK